LVFEKLLSLKREFAIDLPTSNVASTQTTERTLVRTVMVCTLLHLAMEDERNRDLQLEEREAGPSGPM
jgi:hypothetical protein